MRDVLLIDTRNRMLRYRAGRTSLHAAECDIFIADSGGKALEMLRTAVMDAVIVNLSGPEEDAAGLVEQIAQEHPATEIAFLSASEVDRTMNTHFRFQGLIHYLQEYLHNNEAPWGRGQGLRCASRSSACMDSRPFLSYGGQL